MLLPIHGHKDQILEAVKYNQVTILVGETGSGKSTQTPPFLLEAGYGEKGLIGITEPRRIAAITVAEFAAGQYGVECGAEIGYQVRYDDCTMEGTMAKFMTEGILLREILADPDLSKYEIIMVDEAHERSLNQDLLLGLLKQLLKRRPDLKLVVTSATIDSEKFSSYFDDAPIIEIEGRMYPVEITYQPMSSFSNTAQEITDLVVNIHTTKDEGDILVFLTGEEAIRRIADLIERMDLDVEVLPLYAQLPSNEQARVFQQCPRRKVVLATNIAETSVTIDGVVYVIDPGLIKQSNFDADTGFDRLEVVAHSRAGCNQRTGRAGRTQAGECFRLYSESDFFGRDEFTEPEIKRSSLSGVVLQMKMMGIEDVIGFPFLDQPDTETFEAAHRHLISLGALSKDNGITELGRKMAKFPLESHKACQILKAAVSGCLEEVAKIVAMSSTGKRPFFLPREDDPEARFRAISAHAKFKDPSSDHLTMLKLFNAWQQEGGSRLHPGWYHDNFINRTCMQEAGKILDQLKEIARRSDLEPSTSEDTSKILKAITAGLVDSICVKDGTYNYTHTASGQQVFIYPGSALFGHNPPQLLVSDAFVASKKRGGSKTYARDCSKIEADWLVEIDPQRASIGPKTFAYSRSTNGIVETQEILFDNVAIGSTETPATGEGATRALAKEIAEAYAYGPFGDFPIVESLQTIKEQFRVSEELLRTTCDLIATQVIADQLGEATTKLEAENCQLSIPEFLRDKSFIIQESQRIFPTTILVFDQEYEVSYRGMSQLTAEIRGIDLSVAASISQDDLPQIPVDRWYVNRLIDSTEKTFPKGGWTKPDICWKPIRKERPESFPDSVELAGTAVSVSYRDAISEAQIQIPDDLVTKITSEDSLPEVEPYRWSIFVTREGKQAQVSSLSELLDEKERRQTVEKVREAFRELQSLKPNAELFPDTLGRMHIISLNGLKSLLEEIRDSIEKAGKVVKERMEHRQALETSKSKLKEFVDTLLNQCPLCSGVFGKDGICLCPETRSNQALGMNNGQAEKELIKLVSDKGVTLVRISIKRPKDARARVVREIMEVSEPFKDLDVIEAKS